MIPINFNYYQPETIDEAIYLHKKLTGQKKPPLYYGGGSEIISMARVGSIQPTAVIDIKVLPECTILAVSDGKLRLGAGLSLAKIAESKLFPFLGTTVGRIADHTNQCRITLGGNISGTIIYREAILPLLLTDSTLLIAGPNGLRQQKIQEIFNQRIQLSQGEFIVQIIIDQKYLTLPFYHIKKTKNEKIDYPLITISAIKNSDDYRIAFSGLCSFPFRCLDIEKTLNRPDLSIKEKINTIISQLPEVPHNNLSGSSQYRIFVLKNTLDNLFQEWGLPN